MEGVTDEDESTRAMRKWILLGVDAALTIFEESEETTYVWLDLDKTLIAN